MLNLHFRAVSRREYSIPASGRAGFSGPIIVRFPPECQRNSRQNARILQIPPAAFPAVCRKRPARMRSRPGPAGRQDGYAAQADSISRSLQLPSQPVTAHRVPRAPAARSALPMSDDAAGSGRRRGSGWRPFCQVEAAHFRTVCTCIRSTVCRPRGRQPRGFICCARPADAAEEPPGNGRRCRRTPRPRRPSAGCACSSAGPAGPAGSATPLRA